MITWLYGVVLFALGVYSFFLIDPNITFFQSDYWVRFRDWAVYLGYYRRDISWIVYLTLLIFLFVFHFILVRKYKQISAVRVATLVALFGCVSYPFLSHDLFNYLFDARILTHYGLNPYTHTALDFQKDLWTRFMHWTHRTYPYGPTFLPLTLVPSLLGWGKFSLTFILYKLMNGSFYVYAVYLLNRKNRRTAMIFATHPLLIIEGIIASHNDLLAVSLGLIGIYLLQRKVPIWGRVVLFMSAGIKYITAPLAFLHTKLQITRYMKILFCLQLALIAYLCSKMETQPWYFISLFAFLPFFGDFIERLNILFFGLLLSYYPFIRFGDWTAKTITLKHEIVWITIIVQVITLLVSYRFGKREGHVYLKK